MMEKNGRKVPLRLHHPFRQREVVSYTDEEFNVLCDASPQEEKDIWHLLRVSGLRKGELAQTIYSDINARESSIRVTVKPNNDWKPKSQKGHRAIPIPTFLLKLLQARHLRHPGGN
jgi:integrase